MRKTDSQTERDRDRQTDGCKSLFDWPVAFTKVKLTKKKDRLKQA